MKTLSVQFKQVLLCVILLISSTLVQASSFQLKIRITWGDGPKRNVPVEVQGISPIGFTFFQNTNVDGWAIFNITNETNVSGYNQYKIQFFSSASVNGGQFGSFVRDTISITDTNTADVIRIYSGADSVGCRPEFYTDAVPSISFPGNLEYQFTPDTAFKLRNCFYSAFTPADPMGIKLVWTVDGETQLTKFTDDIKDTSNMFKTIFNGQCCVEKNVCLTMTDVFTGNTSTWCHLVQLEAPAANYVSARIFSGGVMVWDSIETELIGITNSYYRKSKAIKSEDTVKYVFLGVPNGKYTVRATPTGPILSPFYTTTYIDSSLSWQDADTFWVNYTQFTPIDLHLQPYFNNPILPRTGILQGFLSGLGTVCYTPIAGLQNPKATIFTDSKVVLTIVNSQNQPIASGFLNPDGTFYMDQLPIGDYFLRIDHPFVNYSQVPVSFTEASPSMVIQATVTASGITALTRTKGQIAREVLRFYPNPTTGQLHIPDFQKISTLFLVNSLGKEIQLAPSAELDIENFPAGLYILKGTFQTGGSFRNTLVKQ